VTAVLNGFGRTLGDSVIGLQALSAARELGGIPPSTVLFRLPGLPPMVQAVYAAAADFCAIQTLPWEDATPERPFPPAAAFHHVIDIRDFAFDPAFRGTAMIDYFLHALGLDPACVPPAMKRNTWLAPRVAPQPPGHGYVLVCPRSSTPMRDMPAPVHAHILAWLHRHAAGPVLSQATLPPAETLPALCGLVAGARLLVSVDTAMLHLADAMGVPTLAFFTTHRPQWRVRDYPLCRAIDLAPESIPDALEFARDTTDITACQAAWTRHGLDWLDPLLTEALHG
jgi:hypothetical protein